jgi:hypothetical protein|nr:MAG TPA: hypothetical protein [Caudoviricetes sp.]
MGHVDGVKEKPHHGTMCYNGASNNRKIQVYHGKDILGCGGTTTP